MKKEILQTVERIKILCVLRKFYRISSLYFLLFLKKIVVMYHVRNMERELCCRRS
jgi:hypothetical protein